jgi:hypothetical protein
VTAPARPSASTITDDELDALYARLDSLVGAADVAVRAIQLMNRAGAERDLLARTIAATSRQTVAEVLADARAALDGGAQR